MDETPADSLITETDFRLIVAPLTLNRLDHNMTWAERLTGHHH